MCVSHRDAVFWGAEGQKRILSGRGKNLAVEYLEADYTIRSDFHCYQGFCRCHRLVWESMIMFFLVSSSASAKDGLQDSTNCGSVHLLFRLSSQVFFCKLLFHTTLFVSCPSNLFFLQHLQIVIYTNLFQIVGPNSFTIFEVKCQEFAPHPTIFSANSRFVKLFFLQIDVPDQLFFKLLFRIIWSFEHIFKFRLSFP